MTTNNNNKNKNNGFLAANLCFSVQFSDINGQIVEK